MRLSTLVRIAASVAAAVAVAVAGASAMAQDVYPSKPILVVVRASVGGPTDIIGRLIEERFSRSVAQAVLVENRLGASATAARATEIMTNDMANRQGIIRALPQITFEDGIARGEGWK